MATDGPAEQDAVCDTYLLVIDGKHYLRRGIAAVVAGQGQRGVVVGAKFNANHDERGRFASGEGGGGGHSELSARLHTIESQIARSRVERAVALDADGRELLHKDGHIADVGFTADEVDSLRDSVITHNHPHGSGLNIGDVNFAMRADVQQLRAVTLTHVHALDRPVTGWPVSAEARRAVVGAYNRTEQRQYDVFDRLISRGHMTPQEAQLTHHHEVMTQFAQEMGWTYKREPLY